MIELNNKCDIRDEIKKYKDEMNNKGNDGKNIVQYSGFLEIDLKTDKIVDTLLQNNFK